MLFVWFVIQFFNYILWVAHIAAVLYARQLFRRECKKFDNDDSLEKIGVTILKPLKGADDANLRENLESFFQIDYAPYEICFCIQDARDPVLALVQELIEKYHDSVDARFYFGGQNGFVINPKIENMCQAYPHAKYEYILVSDANLKATRSFLQNMVELMYSDTALVHQLPYCLERPINSNLLEKVYFGGWQARAYLFLNLIGVNCVAGMSLLIKKKILDECGGLQAFGNYIAEDYFIPKAFHQLGYKTRVANEPAWQNSALSSFDIWRARMIRWTQLRLRFCRAAWLEPLVSCFGQAFLTSFSFLILTNSICISTIYFAAHVALWFFLDIFMIQTIENGNFRHELSKCFCAWLYREFTSYIFFIMSSYNPYVIWKNGTFKLKSDGTGVRIN